MIFETDAGNSFIFVVTIATSNNKLWTKIARLFIECKLPMHSTNLIEEPYFISVFLLHIGTSTFIMRKYEIIGRNYIFYHVRKTSQIWDIFWNSTILEIWALTNATPSSTIIAAMCKILEDFQWVCQLLTHYLSSDNESLFLKII